MQRLLFVFDIGFDRGGPSVHLLQDLMRSGLKRGHKIDVILKNTGGPNKEMPEEFTGNPSFRYFAIKENDEKNYGFIGRYLNEIKYARRISRIYLEQRKYDAVFLESCTTAIFYIRDLKKLKCPVIFNVQDIFPYNLKFSGQLPLSFITFPIFKKLQHMAYQLSDRIITISEDMKQTLIKDGVKEDKIDVVYNWSYKDTPISLNNIPSKYYFDLGIDHSKTNIVYAGNIGKMQNVEMVASAAECLKDDCNYHFYIIGGGVQERKVATMVKDLKNVTMMPMKPALYAESIYAQADINLIPLAIGGIKTALPSKTATVLRVERPVIFCVDKESKLTELLKNDDMAVVVDCRSITDLVTAIKDLSNNKRIGTGNYDLFSIYFTRKNAEKYIEIMEDLISKRRGGLNG